MIDSQEELRKFLPKLRAAKWIAVDTEADSLHAYPEKLCLLQVSFEGEDRLVDPLASIDISPLLEALNDHELIMHGADYDLRLLRKHHDFVPRSIFDTMFAARLVGARQFGLVNLVHDYLNVTLDKGPQKADWSRRPLTERMERYARNDTHHLKPLADRLRQELINKGRLAWHQEMCARLVVECSQHGEPDPDAVWRMKGSSRMSRPALAVLREVWRWREAEARASNKPPFFILQHDKLIELTGAAVHSKELGPLLPHRMSARRRESLVHAVRKGLHVPPDKQPEIQRPKGRRLTEAETARVNRLQAWRDARAAELDIDPTLIASRAMLIGLGRDWNSHASGLMKWQRELLEPGRHRR